MRRHNNLSQLNKWTKVINLTESLRRITLPTGQPATLISAIVFNWSAFAGSELVGRRGMLHKVGLFRQQPSRPIGKRKESRSDSKAQCRFSVFGLLRAGASTTLRQEPTGVLLDVRESTGDHHATFLSRVDSEIRHVSLLVSFELLCPTPSRVSFHSILHCPFGF